MLTPLAYKHEGFKLNPLLDVNQRNALKGRMDCRNCDGSGLFYQIEDTPCGCTQHEGE